MELVLQMIWLTWFKLSEFQVKFYLDTIFTLAYYLLK